MLQLIQKYKNLRDQLACEPGCETSIDELMWNEGILEAMETLLKDVNPDIAKLIRLNHI